MIEISERYHEEIDAMEQYEHMRAILTALDRAIDFARSTVSLVKEGERSPPPDSSYQA